MVPNFDKDNANFVQENLLILIDFSDFHDHLIIIGSDNGLLPTWHQAITWKSHDPFQNTVYFQLIMCYLTTTIIHLVDNSATQSQYHSKSLCW